jgi:Ca2+-binding EF-hand superfamily protein
MFLTPPLCILHQLWCPLKAAYLKDNKNPTSFRDIDNNKDGKITPIELCVIVPDLTLQKFKEYDKNKDGCLNESEFNAVKRTK